MSESDSPFARAKTIPMWWARAFPDEHAFLRKYAMTKGANWYELLVGDILSPPKKTVPPEIAVLRARLGIRVLSSVPIFRPGDGVSISGYGTCHPATVRDVTKEAILVTSDHFVRTKSGRCLYVPSRDAPRSGRGSFIFTPRKNGTFQLQHIKGTYLLFGRSLK